MNENTSSNSAHIPLKLGFGKADDETIRELCPNMPRIWPNMRVRDFLTQLDAMVESDPLRHCFRLAAVDGLPVRCLVYRSPDLGLTTVGDAAIAGRRVWAGGREGDVKSSSDSSDRLTRSSAYSARPFEITASICAARSGAAMLRRRLSGVEFLFQRWFGGRRGHDPAGTAMRTARHGRRGE